MNLSFSITSLRENRTRRVLALAALMSFSTSLLGMAESGKSGWRLEIGPAYRDNMEATVSGSSRTQQSGMQAASAYRSVPEASQGYAPPVGENPDDITQYGNRYFDDGFVAMDTFTGDDGLTVNFGYQNNSQYNAVEDTLTFQSTTVEAGMTVAGRGEERSRMVSTTMDRGFNANGNFDGWGLRADALYSLHAWNKLNLFMLIGIRAFPGMEKNFSGSTFRQTVKEKQTSFVDTYQYTDTIVDTYQFDTGGSPIPPAPYFNPNGDPDNDPTINNLPADTSRDSNREEGVTRSYDGSRTTTWIGENHIALDVDSDLYQLAIGPAFSGELTERLSLNLRPTLLLNLLDVDVDRHEQFVAIDDGGSSMLAVWHDSKSDQEFLIGAGIEAALTVALSESWFITAGVGYEWIDTATVDVGPNKVKLDLSAYTASAAIGMNF